MPRRAAALRVWPGEMNATAYYSDPDKPHVLLVEDDSILRARLKQTLSSDYRIETADNVMQALQAALRVRPDLIVSEVIMPDLDGIGLLKTLRSTLSTQTIPVLLISRHAAPELRIEGFEAGADGYLAKPYTERELKARIRSILQIARVRADAARREAHEQAEQHVIAERATLLESITDAFYALDWQWRFTYINQRAVDYFGKPREEMLGKSLWDLSPHTKGTIFHMQYERVMRERCSVSFEGRSSHSGRWVDVRAYPTPYGIAVNFHDITQRKRVEEALSQAEERYRAFVATSSEGIRRYELREPLDLSLPIEAQLQHLYRHAYLAEANDAMARMYGYKLAEEIVGARLEQLFPPDDEAAQAYLRRAAECGFAYSDLESKVRDRAGNVRFFANSMVPIIENGKLLRTWGTQRDITQRKLAEERLKEADRRKDEFLALLAHELRNPLAPIRSGLQILRLQSATDESVLRTLNMMDRQMTHLVRLVDDLLDVSRITRGKLELRLQRVPLADAIGAAVETVRSKIEAQGHELTIRVQPEVLAVEGDPDRLIQVLANLLSNSAKYTHRGGRITLTLERAGADAVITVQDNGVGIPPSALEHVFDLFSQVLPQGSHGIGGLGIGLWLVRTLVQMHRGSISAFSEGPGRGSTFTIRLPLAESHASDVGSSTAFSDPDTAHVGPYRVLVVDDNVDAAGSLAMLLGMEGHEVQTAYDGEDAVRRADEFRPDIIFMDVGMPRMDGIEATERIRAQPHGHDAFIVAVTGWGQEADRERTHAAGMDQHLVKPVSVEALQSALSSLDERRRLARH